MIQKKHFCRGSGSPWCTATSLCIFHSNFYSTLPFLLKIFLKNEAEQRNMTSLTDLLHQTHAALYSRRLNYKMKRCVTNNQVWLWLPIFFKCSSIHIDMCPLKVSNISSKVQQHSHQNRTSQAEDLYFRVGSLICIFGS